MPKVTLTVFGRHRTIVIRLIVPGDLTASKTIRVLAKRRFDVNKIVILSGHPEGNEGLSASLSILFPKIRLFRMKGEIGRYKSGIT